MLEMEICQTLIRKPPLQCYGFPPKKYHHISIKTLQFFMHYYIHHIIYHVLKKWENEVKKIKFKKIYEHALYHIIYKPKNSKPYNVWYILTFIYEPWLLLKTFNING
jgi:hypothetical protein